jgi:hypothetical protein
MLAVSQPWLALDFVDAAASKYSTYAFAMSAENDLV